MTAYGAVISLENTIQYILNSPHITLAEPSKEIIQPAYIELEPWQEILERLDKTRTSRSRKKVNALDRRIKEIIWEFEDKLESLLYQQILSQSQNPLSRLRLSQMIRKVASHLPIFGDSVRRKVGMDVFSMDLQSLHDDVASFIRSLRDMEKDYIYEVVTMAEDDDDDEESFSSRSGFGFHGTESKMIGLSDQFQQLKTLLIRGTREHVHTLVGTAGVGKTTLAQEIFRDEEIVRHFECRLWVTVGRKPKLTQLLHGIEAQLFGDNNASWITWPYFRKCLIVLDDLWEAQVFDSLLSSISDIKKGFIRVLLTARDREVIANITSAKFSSDIQVVRFLTEEESKELLCEKVFGGKELCPDELDKAAAKIAKKCEGLPLMIVTVADILFKSHNREPKYWNDVAEERNSVFTDAYNRITKVLYPSYNYLSQYLKMPFLFMGVFPPDYDTPPSKIINMLSAEGWFLRINAKESFEGRVWKCLEELCTGKNLVLFNETSIYRNARIIHGCKYKTCRLHSTWRHVCRGEARKNKFYHVLNRLVDAEEEVVKGHRSLCLQNNILFGFKEFCNSVRLNCASSTRSLLFLGPYHQYPTSIDVGFKLLRELDALQLRFYTFPVEILTLVQLKYLALTCNGELPTTISKLFNLRVLIVHPHMSIRRCRAPSYVPIQIWHMHELEHIEILGKSLVAPYDQDAYLEKLLTLVGVNVSICTILELSKRIPNIRKLGVQIELMPCDDLNELLDCFCCISTLESLETLKCSIVNPVIQHEYIVPSPPSSLMLPRDLRKLHLSGMGFPWEYMDVIGSLPFLRILKLRSYAFQGPKWEAREESFPRLEFLLIEDSDLVEWKPKPRSFNNLSYLCMKHCYKLKGIHWSSSFYKNRKIELVDCNPLALSCAEELEPSPYSRLDITATSSFPKKPVTINLQRIWQ